MLLAILAVECQITRSEDIDNALCARLECYDLQISCCLRISCIEHCAFALHSAPLEPLEPCLALL